MFPAIRASFIPFIIFRYRYINGYVHFKCILWTVSPVKSRKLICTIQMRYFNMNNTCYKCMIPEIDSNTIQIPRYRYYVSQGMPFGFFYFLPYTILHEKWTMNISIWMCTAKKWTTKLMPPISSDVCTHQKKKKKRWRHRFDEKRTLQGCFYLI